MDVFSVIILFIAGIGILNLLLMAVYERTREIGLLGALGLKPRQISILFLLEGALMGLVGRGLWRRAGAVASTALLGHVGLDFSKFTSLTDYTALISGQDLPDPGAGQTAPAHVDRAGHRRPGVLLPGARSRPAASPAEALHYV